MSSADNGADSMGRAESAFRESFERLKAGSPERLPKGAIVSQNNVAKEAGRDPSALKKARFPSLIAEIQRWVKSQSTGESTSARQAAIAHRKRSRSLKEKNDALKSERDHALALLVEADAKIVELTLENLELKNKLPAQNIVNLRKE